MPIDLLAQLVALFCSNALCLYRRSILPISFTVTMIWWRRADRLVLGLNFRADMQIRPYHFNKFNGASGYV